MCVCENVSVGVCVNVCINMYACVSMGIMHGVCECASVCV